MSPWYQQGRLVIMDATLENEAPVDLVGDAVKAALMKSTHTPDVDAHDHFDDIAADECDATGYTSRGVALGTKAISRDDANDRVRFTAADTVFSSIGNGTNNTLDTVVILREPDTSPTNANTVLLAYQSIPSVTTNGGDVTMQWASGEVIRLTS